MILNSNNEVCAVSDCLLTVGRILEKFYEIAGQITCVWAQYQFIVFCKPSVVLADHTQYIRAYATGLHPSVVCLSSSVVCDVCIVAKRCVLEQVLLLTAYRKSYIRNRFYKSIFLCTISYRKLTLTFVYRSYQGHVNQCVTFYIEYI